MKQGKEPTIRSDRDPRSMLERNSDDIIATMRKWGIGRVDEKETIHFCGLIHHPDRGPVAFLPREARTGDPEVDLETASLTMQALVRFGTETSKREFERDGEHGNPGLLAVVKQLADDFRDNGLFAERTRIRTRNSGKPDWSRTIKSENPMPGPDGRPVYIDLRTSRSTDNSNALLTQIQCSVLKEILDMHGWWLPSLSSRRNRLQKCTSPPYQRSVWARKLDALLPTLYSARSIFLAEYLSHYLRETRHSSSGTMVFGVSDFHTVWESILRETLHRPHGDGQRNWNSELPKPVYIRANGGEPNERSKGMQTDIILQDDEGYTLVDAKYYSASSARTSPGWPDISKQFFYELALREVVGGDNKIRNIFAFPSQAGKGTFDRVEMWDKGNNHVKSFPSVECHYIPVREALENYVTWKKGVVIERRDSVYQQS